MFNDLSTMQSSTEQYNNYLINKAKDSLNLTYYVNQDIINKIDLSKATKNILTKEINMTAYSINNLTNSTSKVTLKNAINDIYISLNHVFDYLLSNKKVQNILFIKSSFISETLNYTDLSVKDRYMLTNYYYSLANYYNLNEDIYRLEKLLYTEISDSIDLQIQRILINMIIVFCLILIVNVLSEVFLLNSVNSRMKIFKLFDCISRKDVTKEFDSCEYFIHDIDKMFAERKFFTEFINNKISKEIYEARLIRNSSSNDNNSFLVKNKKQEERLEKLKSQEVEKSTLNQNQNTVITCSQRFSKNSKNEFTCEISTERLPINKNNDINRNYNYTKRNGILK